MLCVYLPGECPPPSHSDKRKNRDNWYKYPRSQFPYFLLSNLRMSALRTAPQTSFTLLFPFITRSDTAVDKVWSPSSTRIILSPGPGDTDLLWEGQNKHRDFLRCHWTTRVTSQFLFVDGFYKTKFPLDQTSHKTFLQSRACL